MTSRLRLFAAGTFALTLGCMASPARSQDRAEGSAASSSRSSLVFIVNRDNPNDQLALGDLRRMLLGEVTRWPDGRKLTVAMREPGASERGAVLRLICRMSDVEFTRYLLHAAYRGEAQAGPKQLDTSAGIRRFVVNVLGAIGYIRADEVDESVKVLHIAGGAPQAPVEGLTLMRTP